MRHGPACHIPWSAVLPTSSAVLPTRRRGERWRRGERRGEEVHIVHIARFGLLEPCAPKEGMSYNIPNRYIVPPL